jgi:hypothetical protein
MPSQRHGRPMANGAVSRGLTSVSRWLAVGALLIAVAPSPIQAQMGMLKKLKKAVTAPDSSARAQDSLAQIAAGVLPESVKVNKGSLLQRGGSVVSTASGALEQTTGISAKDAALAATGVGAGNLLAKKMGVDPMSIGKAAMANAKMNAQQRAMQRAAGGAGSMGIGGLGAGVGGLAGHAPNAAAMAGMPGIAGFSQADAEALVAFQQEMMTVAMAASSGDERAKARLDAWQSLALKHQPEIERLSLTAGAGDMAAVQKLQQIQLTLIREWSSTGSTRQKATKSKRP